MVSTVLAKISFHYKWHPKKGTVIVTEYIIYDTAALEAWLEYRSGLVHQGILLDGYTLSLQ